MPKVPPIVVAAVARGSSVTSERLAAMHQEVLDLLHQHDVHPMSLSADGADTERSVQRIIANSTSDHLFFCIPNNAPNCSIEYKLPIAYGSHPLVITQDSKHAAKTARNQLHTGARMPTLGHYTAHYAMIREVAENPASPLQSRDAKGLDKQDDRAAARLFSAQTLEFLTTHYNGRHGLAIYLFVLGELVDAWQNRSISHRERVKMVLRARFFLMAWRTHILAHPDHSLDTHFISRQSYDIFITLSDSLIMLIVVHRKFFPLFPLLPWFHSTEPCEHYFGLLRQLKIDFAYIDVLHLERKASIPSNGRY
ncbi:ULP-PROTEASE domain-containing protein [Mycena indigotica]|uniref:ULP-PROTEASE domain-containing protein n=1 Tax=Mycena indigotica TaxID=2126181 RepID=A0A8H6SUX8_9AGAR|nr:ULP-PROTEASE domain-containing protein [Mycena indigotica]KAF7306358.1 ULP-PROTEASE domain-containing protein [Mycena indigotica]